MSRQKPKGYARRMKDKEYDRMKHELRKKKEKLKRMESENYMKKYVKSIIDMETHNKAVDDLINAKAEIKDLKKELEFYKDSTKSMARTVVIFGIFSIISFIAAVTVTVVLW